ncbi:MAG: hypothetical protein PHW14_04870 [Candidatus Omnitrophica bacterium]|nr:hypothetical protein [Candidatus Omnitrophota bacterium]
MDRRELYENKVLKYLDKDFPQKSKNPNFYISCESELIIGYEFLMNGYDLKKKKTEGPDFLIQDKNRNIWVEVVAPEEGQHPRLKNKERLSSGEMAEVDSDNCKLQMASAICSKKDKFKLYVQKGIVSQEDIKIICVNLFNLGSGKNSCPYIASVLYGLEEVRWVDVKTMQSGTEYLPHKPAVKKTGAKIDFGLFLQTEYEKIDGVIWFDYSLRLIVPEEYKIEFFANANRKEKIGDLFPKWRRVYYENGFLTS